MSKVKFSVKLRSSIPVEAFAHKAIAQCREEIRQATGKELNLAETVPHALYLMAKRVSELSKLAEDLQTELKSLKGDADGDTQGSGAVESAGTIQASDSQEISGKEDK